jgi:hypothetical protein
MHNDIKVERALFYWGKWRQSIIAQWIEWAACPDQASESNFLNRLVTKSKSELAKLRFPNNLLLELYWVCCIASNCTFDHRTSFNSIVITSWLPEPFYRSICEYLKPGKRIFPPYIFRKEDEILQFRRFGDLGLVKLRSAAKRGFAMLIPSDHHLYDVLSKFKGASKTLGDPGRPPIYSDRLAVMCAVWKDRQDMSDEDIQKKIDTELNDKMTLQGRVSNINHPTDINHLIKRGRKLINDYSNKHNRVFLKFHPDSIE